MEVLFSVLFLIGAMATNIFARWRLQKEMGVREKAQTKPPVNNQLWFVLKNILVFLLFIGALAGPLWLRYAVLLCVCIYFIYRSTILILDSGFNQARLNTRLVVASFWLGQSIMLAASFYYLAIGAPNYSLNL